MDYKLKQMARTGYAAKGTVYGITGVLTFLAAFNLGGSKTSKIEVLQFLDKQPFGNVLLLILGVGLICYAAWRLIQAVSDPENIGDDKKGVIKRIAYFVSGCIYLGLAGLAIGRVIGSISSGGSTGGSGGTSSSMLASDIGLIALGAVGAIFIATGIYQFVRVYKSEFLKKFDLQSMSEEKRRKTIKNTGYLGLSARGIIFLIIGYFALHAAITSNPSEIKTTSDAFSFLQESSHGAWLLGVVAAGLVCYAVYMFMMAIYRKFRDDNSSYS